MSADLWFVQRCLDMQVGVFDDYPPEGLRVFRWPDCWWVLWHRPLHNTALGRELPTPLELRACLAGNPNVGTPITLETHVRPELLK